MNPEQALNEFKARAELKKGFEDAAADFFNIFTDPLLAGHPGVIRDSSSDGHWYTMSGFRKLSEQELVEIRAADPGCSPLINEAFRRGLTPVHAVTVTFEEEQKMLIANTTYNFAGHDGANQIRVASDPFFSATQSLIMTDDRYSAVDRVRDETSKMKAALDIITQTPRTLD